MDSPSPRQVGIREVGPLRGAAEFAGVLLHGRGRTPEEKIDLAARLSSPEPIRWLVPTADTGGSWYPNRYMDPVALNEPALTHSLEKCHAALTEASDDGRLGPERLAIVGFSQGACLAIEYALRYPSRCNTVTMLTGALMGIGTGIEDHWKAKGKLLDGVSIFLSGSDADDWIAEQATLGTAAFLSELGAKVTLRIYRGRLHIVSPEELAEAQAFLKSHLLKNNSR